MGAVCGPEDPPVVEFAASPQPRPRVHAMPVAADGLSQSYIEALSSSEGGSGSPRGMHLFSPSALSPEGPNRPAVRRLQEEFEQSELGEVDDFTMMSPRSMKAQFMARHPDLASHPAAGLLAEAIAHSPEPLRAEKVPMSPEVTTARNAHLESMMRELMRRHGRQIPDDQELTRLINQVAFTFSDQDKTFLSKISFQTVTDNNPHLRVSRATRFGGG
eukprot:TRINITY_DN94276_c0_g1_i1.p1 TRINITY_DN94276_c0_g1~~TRINITY_DN94276_c0_g1_i1.p1  ORF type:complete len:217 (-),score=37.73 TRINITY_DN94276_c0_g1_i1:142-792(-)